MICNKNSVELGCVWRVSFVWMLVVCDDGVNVNCFVECEVGFVCYVWYVMKCLERFCGYFMCC